jgi:isoleucyl-tRNA synthetase
LIDPQLEKAMATAQAVVGLGRSLRQDSGIKTRQPLGRLVIHADDERASMLLDDERLTGYVAEELNVKQLGTVADPREVASLTAKANYTTIGPRFGQQAPAAAQLIESLAEGQILALRREGTLTVDFAGTPTTFSGEEIFVLEEGIGPFVATSGLGLTVAIDTTLDDELRAEGLCREIINKVQNLRKKSGLEVSDRIELAIEGPPVVLEAVSRFAERIARETLAVEIASTGDLPYKEAFKIDDQELSIALAKA